MAHKTHQRYDQGYKWTNEENTLGISSNNLGVKVLICPPPSLLNEEKYRTKTKEFDKYKVVLKLHRVKQE